MKQTKVHLSQRQVWAVYENKTLRGTFAACGSAFGDTTPQIAKVTCKNCQRIIRSIQRQFCPEC